jgi:hypothetical protein
MVGKTTGNVVRVPWVCLGQVLEIEPIELLVTLDTLSRRRKASRMALRAQQGSAQL